MSEEEGSLRKAAYAGGRWMGIQNIGLQVLTLLTTAVLARILTPEDFGLVAIVTVVVGLFSLVNQLGWGAALVVRSEISTAAVSTAFWAASAFGAATAAALVALAGPVSALFGSPEAESLLRAIAIVLVLSPAAGVARSLLTRSLRYRALSILTISQQVTYAIVAILLASVAHLGVWSIVWGRVAAAAVGLVLALVVARPPVRLAFSRSVLAADLRFNAGFLGSRLVSYLGKNIDYWGVGRYLGSSVLGAYYVAYAVPDLVRRRATGVIQQTLFPLFARVAGEPDRLGRAYGETVGKLVLLLSPMLVGFALLARPLLAVVFGEQWVAAVAPARIIAIAALFGLAVAPAVSAFNAIGRPHLAAVVSAARLAVIGGALLPVARVWGVTGVAAVVLVGSGTGGVIAAWLLGRRLGAPMRVLFGPVSPSLVPLTFMTLTTLVASRLLAGLADWLLLVVVVPIGALAYIGSGWALHKESFVGAFRDLAGIVGLQHPRSL